MTKISAIGCLNLTKIIGYFPKMTFEKNFRIIKLIKNKNPCKINYRDFL